MSPVRIRFSPMRIQFLLALAIVWIAGSTPDALAKIWKNSAGDRQIEAEFVEVQSDQAILKKPDGKILKVPVAKLSKEDQDFVQARQGSSPADPEPRPAKKSESENPPAEKTTYINTFERLAAAAARCDSAKEGVELYHKFLANAAIAPSEIQAAKNNLPIWESRAAKNMVRHGTRWVEPTEAQLHKEAAHQLVLQGIKLFESNQGHQAQEKLAAASREAPGDIEAEFLLGVGFALVARNPTNAKRHFTECIRRDPSNVAALNNLALAEIRLRGYDSAVSRWQLALKQAGASPEIVQNIGRLLYMAQNRSSNIPSSAVRKAKELEEELSAQAKSFDRSVGWLYMRLSPGTDITAENGRRRRTSHGEEGASMTTVLAHFQRAARGSSDSRLGEDRRCMICNGSEIVKCPAKLCKNGTVPGGTKREVVGRNPNGQEFHMDTPTRVKCPVCEGKGQVRCTGCRDGIDKSLL